MLNLGVEKESLPTGRLSFSLSLSSSMALELDRINRKMAALHATTNSLTNSLHQLLSGAKRKMADADTMTQPEYTSYQGRLRCPSILRRWAASSPGASWAA